jgi:hypothetical protein
MALTSFGVTLCNCQSVTVNTLQGLQESGREFVYLSRMIARKSFHNPFALACHLQDRSPAIGDIRSSHQQTFALRPVNQFNYAVMAQAESFCGKRDGHSFAIGRTRHL